jgi:hypothetical protein
MYLESDTLICSNNTKKNIKDIKSGDKIKGWGNYINTVSVIKHINKFDDSFNEINYYVSLNNDNNNISIIQPILTIDGWKSFDPNLTLKFYPSFSEKKIGRLQVGDCILRYNNYGSYSPCNIDKIDKKKQNNDGAYFISLMGNDTIIVNDYVIHNVYDVNCDKDEIPGILNLTDTEKTTLIDLLNKIRKEIAILYGEYDAMILTSYN